MDQKTRRHLGQDNRWFVGFTIAGLFAGAFLIAVYLGIAEAPIFFCNNASQSQAKTYLNSKFTPAPWTELQLNAIIHYATSRETPQQSMDEIRVSFDVLKTRLPCNFLVFGLGHDSVMWASLNPGGTTLFLEEDPKWIQTVLRSAPHLRAHHVKYRTQLSEADELLEHYRTEPSCWPNKPFVKGNEKCRLALNMLPEEVYDREWDLIMIDAPKGYFAEAPGRMAAIYSAAVMARNRKGSGVTHVFLHDVDRKVEKEYSDKFLCQKYLVKSVGRLRHFVIPPSPTGTDTSNSDHHFC